MRKTLFTAAAVAPLVLLAGGPALADTTVESGSSTVTTATVNNGQPDNVIVDSGATVNVNGANTSAVILNSNNNVTNNGTISINANANNNNTNAVLLNGGFSGSLTNVGAITNTDGYTPSTNSTNGFADGAFAQGSSRYGVRLVGPGSLTGSIDIESGSSITVQGNNSYGMSLEAPLIGSLTQAGAISVTGSSSTGLSESGGVSGNIQITGAISSTGGSNGSGQPGSVGLNLSGDVGGSVSIESAILSTGYRTTVRNVDPSINAELTSDQIQQSGAAAAVGANVAQGVFLGSPPAGTVSSDTTTDADNDGNVDSGEGTGSIATYGSAPALVIGANRNIEIGVSPFGATTNTYGLILEGNVTGNGVFDTYNANAIQIGGLGGNAVIDGGISITDTSTVSTQAYEANATTIHFGAGGSTPQLVNSGTITALSTETTTENVPYSTTAIQIDQGATLQKLYNYGVINSNLTGDTGSAVAVVDQGGKLSYVMNQGTITALITPASPTDTESGQQVALNLSSNTTGVTLVQQANQNPVANPSTNTNSSGATVTFATTVSPAAPSITGDILLGNGPNTVQFSAGTVTGALNTGSGNSTIDIEGGATYTGALTVPGTLGITVGNGTLIDGSTSKINAPYFNVGASGVFNFGLDPANTTTPITVINVNGTATIANGAQLGVKMISLLGNAPSYSYTVLTAQQLSVGASAGYASISGATAQTPYLFVGSFTENAADNALTLNIRRRTAAEADVNAAEAAAWNPVYDNLNLNTGIESALLSQTTAAGYKSMVDQLLPADYAGGAFRGLAWMTEQAGVASADPPLAEDQQGPTRAWTQEIVLTESKDPTAQTSGYNLLGFGAVAGLESVSPHGNALGMMIGFSTVNIRDPDVPGDNLLGVSDLNAGVYWRGNFHGLQADAGLGAGFIFADSRREFLFGNSTSTSVVHNVALADWNGYTFSGHFGLQYRADIGNFFIEPKVHADYFRMYQTGYTETGGGVGYDLQVDPRTGDLVSVTGSMIMGMTFGNTGFRWAPQVEVGYRDILSGNAGTTTALFAGGTSDAMTLAAQPIKGGQMLARVGVRMYTDYVDVLLDAGAQIASDYTDLDVHLTARTVF